MKQKENVAHAPRENKKVKIATLALGIFLLLIVAIGALVFLTYRTTFDGRETSGAVSAALTLLPAAVVDGDNFISLAQLQSNLAAMRRFYETQDYSAVGLRVDFTTNDGKKRLLIKEKELLNKMIEDRFVVILAEENGISISKEAVDSNLQRKLDEFGNKDDVVKDLASDYGWTIEEFKREIVLPDMYKEELAKKVTLMNADANLAAREKIEKAQKDLSGGADFAEVAKRYSEGSTAGEGGELGWVTQGQLDLELGQALFASPAPERFAITESSLGFHILDIEEKKKGDDGDLLRIRQIFVRKKTFVDWLDTQIKERKALLLLKGFTWNKEAAAVDFSTEEMKQFEKTIMERSQGDASLLF